MNKKALFGAGLMALALTGCAKYRSSCTTIMSTESRDSYFDIYTFYRFEGTKVIELKNEDESDLKYKASLTEGNINVYYDFGDGKKELFTIKSGETVNNKITCQAKSIYLIIEASETCETGNFEFTFKTLSEE